MKKIILTGDKGGIGSAIADLLQANNFQIIPIKSRLENLDRVDSELAGILQTSEIDGLVHCAGYGIFRPHEDIPNGEIQKLIAVNLTAPIAIIRRLLPALKGRGGHIINICSIEATRHTRHSALYTAVKSGLRDFSLALFEEVRKSNIKVTSLNPDMTRTGFFKNLSFEPSADPACSLAPADIASTVLHLLHSEAVISDLTIRPQKAGVYKKG